MKHWIEGYFNIIKLPYLISGYNTFTFHWWYYYDFGVVGVILLPFLEGLIIGYLYYQLRTKPDILIVILYSSCVLLMILSFFMNHLNRLDFMSNIILIWFIHRFIIKKNIIIKSVRNP
jgi:oligosaccharide repeat unit polymerase